MLDEAGRQQAVDQSGAAQVGRNSELDAIVGELSGIYEMPLAAVSIISQNRQIVIASTGTSIEETPRSAAFCAVAIHRPGEPLVVRNAATDPRFSTYPTVTGEPFVRFYAGMPIVSRDGYPLGALCMVDTRPRHEEIDVTRLLILAHQAERLLWR